jgi:hypothetical protein
MKRSFTSLVARIGGLLVMAGLFLGGGCPQAYAMTADAPAPQPPALRALLIGVADYPFLDRKHWLQGPENDVQLLAKVLRERGVAAEAIQILTTAASEPAVQPTRNNILAALDQLVRETEEQKTELVLVFFAGHGSQIPVQDGTSGNEEPDGRDEIILPMDVKAWDGDKHQVPGAITDNEIGDRITRMRRAGAFVWAIFDACHSGTITRGPDVSDLRYRYVSDDDLGVPSSPPPALPGASRGPSLTEDATMNWGAYVGFSAAQSHQKAPEMPLPRCSKEALPASYGRPLCGDDNQVYGVFSYQVAKALQGGKASTYRQLAQLVTLSYREEGFAMPQPLFEGDGQDLPIMGKGEPNLVKEWPLLPVQPDRWRIETGLLDEVPVGSLLLALPSPTATPKEALGCLEVARAGLTHSEVRLLADPSPCNLQAAPDATDLPRNAFARLFDRKMPYGIQVALPGGSDPALGAGSADERQVLAFLQKWTANPDFAGGMFSFVAAGESAEVRLHLADGRLWFLPAGGEWVPTGPAASPAISILPLDEDRLQREIRQYLNAIAKALNLLRLADASQRESRLKVHAELHIQRPGDEGWQRQDLTSPPRLRDGDKVRFTIANDESRSRGVSNVDVGLLLVDARYGIRALAVPCKPCDDNKAACQYPQYSVRLHPGDSQCWGEPVRATKTAGLERVLLIAIPATSHMTEDFSWLAQDTLPAAQFDRDRGSGFKGFLREAGFGQERTTRGGSANGLIIPIEFFVETASSEEPGPPASPTVNKPSSATAAQP